ncbi:MAG: DUF3795 domain-containing protein [Dehalococcoidales bacterium]|nr:MAG: DUF3795 domain-containing protein [Dehalococcoidales bacterium]
MINENSLAASCGLYCRDCHFLGERCSGCGNVQGKPFWTGPDSTEACPLYDCCVNKEQLEHCGLCGEFPCEKFASLRDPSMSDEEAEKSLRQRQKDLNLRKEMGTEAWLRERQ